MSKRKTLKQVLMERDNLSDSEAQELIDECVADLHERLDYGQMPFDILEEYFGLEPDYLMEIMPI